MLFIYDEHRAECIRLNINIEKQCKRLFSKYASNLAFLIYKRQKSHLIVTEHLWMSNHYAIVYILFFLNFFWMKVFRNLTIKDYNKKKHWFDKAFQASVENFYFYYNDFVTEKFDFNHVVKTWNKIEIDEFKYIQSI